VVYFRYIKVIYSSTFKLHLKYLFQLVFFPVGLDALGGHFLEQVACEAGRVYLPYGTLPWVAGMWAACPHGPRTGLLVLPNTLS
jgi:hypothetical protein